MKFITKIMFICIFSVALAIPGFATEIYPSVEQRNAYIDDVNFESLQGQNPYIYISSYSVTEGYIEAGATFTLRAYITNANIIEDAYNIMGTFFFVGDDGFIILDEKSNQFYLQFLGGGETAYIDIPMKAGNEIISPSVSMEFNFVYSNNNGVTYNNVSMITLRQHYKSEITLQAYDIPAKATINDSTLLNLQFENTGESLVKDIIITLTGDFENSPIIFEQDSLNVGETFNVENSLNFLNLGESAVEISMTYKNDSDVDISSDPEVYIVNVEDQATPGVVNIAPSNRPNSGIFSAASIWLFVLAAAGLVALTVVWVLVQRRILNRKRER